ncbi:MAG TPA: SAM-dependent methyltransferase [Steroidobacteraceae bacterium]|nr:SAM-dependent methyltransferase [Steroidobacteraceae bacterium]
MQPERASRTALSAAAHRAAHQLVEHGVIFPDPLALLILGADGELLARESAERPDSRRMRFLIAARARFAEEALGKAIERGVRQLVVLGAGLDTYAYRTSSSRRLRVFEVDHPATQACKGLRLREAGIPIPAQVTFVGVDFERNELSQRLVAAGFDTEKPAFFTWLGVVPYLAHEAVWSMLAFIAALPGGAHVVFDYGDPPETLAPQERAAYEQDAQRVAELGEPWVSFFEPEELHARLNALGFREIEDLLATELVGRYLPVARAGSRRRGAHVLCATNT